MFFFPLLRKSEKDDSYQEIPKTTYSAVCSSILSMTLMKSSCPAKSKRAKAHAILSKNDTSPASSHLHFSGFPS